jgi:hypothetical protein
VVRAELAHEERAGADDEHRQEPSDRHEENDDLDREPEGPAFAREPTLSAAELAPCPGPERGGDPRLELVDREPSCHGLVAEPGDDVISLRIRDEHPPQC